MGTAVLDARPLVESAELLSQAVGINHHVNRPTSLPSLAVALLRIQPNRSDKTVVLGAYGAERPMFLGLAYKAKHPQLTTLKLPLVAVRVLQQEALKVSEVVEDHRLDLSEVFVVMGSSMAR